MKSIAVDVASGADVSLAQARPANRIGVWLELTKPRIASFIVLVTAAGFYLGSPASFDFRLFAVALVGITLLSGGIAALNQYIERDLDARMRRTANRPLPSARISATQGLLFGAGLTLAGELVLLLFVNRLTALVGALTAIGYVLVYTPLKTRTSLATWLGAFPGAVPPLIGFAAARGELPLLAWALFAILFLWQFPHFLAIAWLYRDDYRDAGIKMLPVTESSGAIAGTQMVIYALLLIPASLLPIWLGVGGRFYFVGACLLGAGYLWSSIGAALSQEREAARRLLLASVIYLPLLFTLLLADR